MLESAYQILEEGNLTQFNRSRGRQLTYSQEPDVKYIFPETDVQVYSHEPSFKDVVHPFRPSSEYVVQAVHRGHFHYFEASEDDIRSMDRKLTGELEGLDNTEYYKKIRSV